MLILGNNRMSKLSVCLGAAPHYLPSNNNARTIFDKQRATLQTHWNEVCEQAKLSAVDKENGGADGTRKVQISF